MYSFEKTLLLIILKSILIKKPNQYLHTSPMYIAYIQNRKNEFRILNLENVKISGDR